MYEEKITDLLQAKLFLQFRFDFPVEKPAKKLASCKGNRSARSPAGTNVARIPKATKREPGSTYM